MMKRKLLAVFLVLTMVISVLPSAFAAESVTELTQNGLKNLGYQLSSGSYKLTETVEVDGTLKISRNQEVTLDLNGMGLTQKSGAQVSVVTLEDNAKLTLNDSNPEVQNSGIQGGYLNDGRGSSDNVTEEFVGGAFYISSGAVLTINGGTIRDCAAYDAGGVYIAGGGKLIMNGGSITSCWAKKSDGSAVGGVFVSENGQFEMNGGNISFCTVTGLITGLSAFSACVRNCGVMSMSGTSMINYGFCARVSGNDVNEAFGFMNFGTLYAGGGKVYGFANYGTVEAGNMGVTSFYHLDCFGGTVVDDKYTLNNGTIKSGKYHDEFMNGYGNGIGTISGGTFYATVENRWDAIISGGTFYGTVKNEEDGIVSGGKFLGDVEGIYTVTFDAKGGITVPEKQWRACAPATKPADPTKDGYIFGGWYNGNVKYDFTENVPENITLTANWADAECFNIDVGGTYYFDLSGEDLPGEINDGSHLEIGECLTDATLHYVPFTYAGTISSYALQNSDSAANESIRSIFVADTNMNVMTSWNELNEAGYIYGKSYTSGGVDYIMRAPSGGSSSTGSGNNKSGLPYYNDWDSIISKNSDYIKTLNALSGSSQTLSFAQDMSAENGDMAVMRGIDYRLFDHGFSREKWGELEKSDKANNVGYRPLLELPSSLGKNDIRTVTLDLGGGTVNSEGTIKLAVAAANAFSAPAKQGLTAPVGSDTNSFCWVDENGEIYLPGESVPKYVSKLTAKWFGKDAAQLILSKNAYYAANCTGTLYAAAYTGDMLTDVRIKQISGTERVKLADMGLNTVGADKIKVLIWDDKNAPICQCAETELSDE